MSDAVSIALIVATPTTITAIGGLFLAWRNLKKEFKQAAATNREILVNVDGNLSKAVRQLERFDEFVKASPQIFGGNRASDKVDIAPRMTDDKHSDGE